MSEKNIPYIVYESAQAKNERTVRRLVVALVIAVLLIFASNVVWLYEWSQYDYGSAESTVKIDAKEGMANYIGNDGDMNNGADSGDQKSTRTD